MVAIGPRIQVYLDGGSMDGSGSIVDVPIVDVPIADFIDNAYSSGYFGANVFNGTGIVQNLKVEPWIHSPTEHTVLGE